MSNKLRVASMSSLLVQYILFCIQTVHDLQAHLFLHQFLVFSGCQLQHHLSKILFFDKWWYKYSFRTQTLWCDCTDLWGFSLNQWAAHLPASVYITLIHCIIYSYMHIQCCFFVCLFFTQHKKETVFSCFTSAFFTLHVVCMCLCVLLCLLPFLYKQCGLAHSGWYLL